MMLIAGRGRRELAGKSRRTGAFIPVLSRVGRQRRARREAATATCELALSLSLRLEQSPFVASRLKRLLALIFK